MVRLDTLQDVVALLRRYRVVDDARLDSFLNLFRAADLPQLEPVTVLALLAEQGLLTRYQVDELVAGRGDHLRIGGHLILDRLGRGGMGEVFLAEHDLLQKRVAVKVLAAGAEARTSTRERFTREAQAAAALDHPNVVQVFSADVTHNPPFLVMEHVDGISLQAAVARHGAFSAGEAAAVGVQIAWGLQAAANVGLVHRDIKPANVLIDRNGLVKILDLGIARFMRDPTARATDGPLMLGTLDYIAPEQAVDSSNVDIRADLYSLGATLYFLLAGHPPFPDEDVCRKLDRKQSSDPPPLHQLRPDVPVELSTAIQCLLARVIADRPATPTQAADMLAPWVAVGPNFPGRLFEPWRLAPGDTIEAVTDGGCDPNPTPLPPTRRITWHQATRSVPPCPSPTPAPIPALPPIKEFKPPTEPVRHVVDDAALDGPPTVRLRPLQPHAQAEPVRADVNLAPDRPKVRRMNWRRRHLWWIIGGILVVAGVLAAAVFRASERLTLPPGATRP